MPQVEEGIEQEVGNVADRLPVSLHRKTAPALPEMSQLHVLRHYARLSQENLGVDLNIDIGQGTCTMKYSPKVNDQLARSPKLADLHPLQDESTVQGILEVMWRLEQFLKELSGMDRFSLQPGAGSAAIYTNVAMVRAYHESRGEGTQRNQVITTIFSHPSNAACAKVAGYGIVTIYPDLNGYPDLGALRAAVSERTAALFITNPEDTGIFNPRIEQFVKAVHDVGGLCVYDQANANGILGITRARDAGFDMCHFNLHKTFSVPHGGGGPGAGPVMVRADLARFLPGPIVTKKGRTYRLTVPKASIGRVKSFFGNFLALVRAYAYIRSFGIEHLSEIAQVSVLNANYLLARLRGAYDPQVPERFCKHEFVLNGSRFAKEYNVRTLDVAKRIIDYGFYPPTIYFPLNVPECLMIEPTESQTKDSLDEFAEALLKIAQEAKTDPQLLHDAPHNAPLTRLDDVRAARRGLILIEHDGGGEVSPHRVDCDGRVRRGHRGLGRLGDLLALVRAAGRAGAVREHRLLALGALHHVDRLQLEVRSPAPIAPHAAGPLLRNAHVVLLPLAGGRAALRRFTASRS